MSHLTIVFMFASFAAGLLVGSAFVRSVGGFVAYLLLYLAGFVFVAVGCAAGGALDRRHLHGVRVRVGRSRAVRGLS
jgi:hypothetical protein